VREVSTFRFRLVDTAGSELGIVSEAVPNVEIGDTVRMPDGREVEVVDVYDDEFGQEGDVQATLVVDDGSDMPTELSPERAEELRDLVDELGLGSHLDEIARLGRRLLEGDMRKQESADGGDSRSGRPDSA
jgi:hypothetical protein